jgi:CubicO group peptidase (beta-lactamase class C family)
MKRILFSFGFLLLAVFRLYAQLPIDTSSYLNGSPNVYSLIIAKNDRVLYTRFFNHHKESDLFNDQSLTKSVVSLLIGIAIDKGYIKSVDEKIIDFFPELKNDPDKRKSEVTLRQIMNQASGLYHEDLARIPEFLRLPDPGRYVLQSPMADDPGKLWHYNNAATHLLSVILTKSTGMDTRSFAKKFLFDPMGIPEFDWEKMRDGYYDGCGLLSIRLHSQDLLRIGSLFLHDGLYNNRRIIPAQWINRVLQPDVFYPSGWGFEPSTYALCWYHTEFKGTKILYGMGWGGQFLIIIPSLRSVVVINENIADATAVQQSITFINRVFPLIFDQLK